MTDYLDRLILTESGFRADVISALHPEAERHRHHHAIVADQQGAPERLDQLATVLEGAADRLGPRRVSWPALSAGATSSQHPAPAVPAGLR